MTKRASCGCRIKWVRAISLCPAGERLWNRMQSEYQSAKYVGSDTAWYRYEDARRDYEWHIAMAEEVKGDE